VGTKCADGFSRKFVKRGSIYVKTKPKMITGPFYTYR